MVFQNDILAGASGSIPTYQIDHSLRLGAASSQYLSRTFAADDGDTWTLSMWLKRGALSRGTNQCIYGVTGYSTGHLFLNPSEVMQVNDDGAFATNSTQVFRDPSAWSHYLFRSNGTASSAFYNGELITFPSAYNLNQYNRGVLHYLFRAAAAHYFDGYAAEVAFVSDQYLAYTDFTEFSTDGPLVPKDLSDIDFSSGTNSYYLKFENSGDLGEDSSGNNNDWTVNNSPVQVTDTPTENYATWNPLDRTSNATPSDGNLRYGVGAGVGYVSTRSTIAIPASGKFYWEITHTSNGGAPTARYGVASSAASLALNTITAGEIRTVYTINGQKYDGSTSSTYGAAIPTGNVVGVAVDMDAGTIKFASNNQWADGSGSFNQTYADGTAAYTDLASSGKEWFAYVYIVQAYGDVSFGQSGFTYTPPTGFSALSTANLPTPAIADGSKYFQTTLYTGNGTAIGSGGLAVSQSENSTFQPDLVWIKGRSGATEHVLTDAVRGVTKELSSNDTGAEETVTEGLTTFGSAGFTVGSDGSYNTSSATYAGWQWLAANGTATNEVGTITSTVSVNTTAGFSIVRAASMAGSGGTIGHGLSQAPDMVIGRMQSAVFNWWVWHRDLTGGTYSMKLNDTSAQAAVATVYTAEPTSTVINTGASWTGGNPAIFYCFHEVEGFSKFGSYTGNGSTDGPFIFTGFKPAWVVTKRTNSADNWAMYDAARDPYNVAEKYLYGDTTAAETTYSTAKVDFLSNGFKWRGAVNFGNASGGTYVYMAFAENPFGGTGVAPATAR